MDLGGRMGIAVDLLSLQLRHSIRAARFAVDGLTDPELRWEPVRCSAGSSTRRIASTSRRRRSTTTDSTSSGPTQWDGRLPTWQLIWAIVAEQLHHGAEIGTLRDVRRGHARAEWWPEL
ncbi:MAG: hypothetical protein ACXW1S_07960, partial [Acidimicrobiia bacterium]